MRRRIVSVAAGIALSVGMIASTAIPASAAVTTPHIRVLTQHVTINRGAGKLVVHVKLSGIKPGSKMTAFAGPDGTDGGSPSISKPTGRTRNGKQTFRFPYIAGRYYGTGSVRFAIVVDAIGKDGKAARILGYFHGKVQST